MSIDLRCCDVADAIPDAAGAGLVHADPPWGYDRAAGRGGTLGQYDTLELEQIAQHLDQAYEAAADDVYLLLWATFPKLFEWYEASVGLRWAYKSGGVWGKTDRLGVGYHWRGDAELLLLYTKGTPRARDQGLSNLFLSKRTTHSEKPYGWLVRLVEAFSDPDDLVLDLYAGRAPLAAACRDTGRRYLGAEIDADRWGDAMERLGLDSGQPGRTVPMFFGGNGR